MNNILFFGPPGAGKGTQAKIISNLLNIPHLSTGDILRSKIEEKDPLALKVKQTIADGKLVSDDILNSIVADRLKKDGKNGFILDGYPRTLDQSDFLNSYLKNSGIDLDYIFNIFIDFDVLKNRILKRSQEEQREDDNINVLKTRYSAYTDTTSKVSERYMRELKQIFFEIDGDLQIQEITSKIKKILKIS